MIRNDLSTIWCELTSSIRTRPLDDAADIGLNDVPVSKAGKNGGGGKSNNDGTNESAVSSQPSQQEVKEYCGLVNNEDLVGGLWVPGIVIIIIFSFLHEFSS